MNSTFRLIAGIAAAIACLVLATHGSAANQRIRVATKVSMVTDLAKQFGGTLFSDAMGTPGQMETGYDPGTYEGMTKHNLTTIMEALK